MSGGVFDKTTDRANSASKRWGGKDVIALTIGDTDFKLATPIREAIQTRLEHGVLGYDGVPESVYQLFIDRVKARYGWQLRREWLTVLPNVVQGLNFSCRGNTQPGESVITETPVYYPFLEAPPNSNRGICRLPAIDSGSGWQFDLEGFEALCAKPETRLFLFCHPQNPLGRVLDQQTLEAIAEISELHNVLVCSDEIHCDLVYDDNQHIPFAATSEQAEQNSITLMSPSKAFSISGLGGAFAIIPDEQIREQFLAASAGVVPNLNSFSVVALEAAYRDCDDWLNSQLRYLTENRNYLVSELRQLGLKCYSPGATYFLWLGFQETGINNPYQALLDVGLELTDGEPFGAPGYLRLNFASPRETLEIAVQRAKLLN